MNVMPQDIIVNSCQYTPVYLVENPSVLEGGSYFIAQNNVEEPKPITNLKAFYESSGNIENSVVNVNLHRPRIVRRQRPVVEKKLKLASFLHPTNENVTQQQPYIVKNIMLKSNVTSKNGESTAGAGNSVPQININSKIVKLNHLDFKPKRHRVERPAPKTKPKEITQNVTPVPITSVQLVKLGETYHSLNQLSEQQMKLVTQALKIFNDPDKIAPEPAYDPETNTKYIYKLVSPKDIKVVGENKAQGYKIIEAKIDKFINNYANVITKDSIKKDLFHEKKDSKKDLQLKDKLAESLVKNEPVEEVKNGTKIVAKKDTVKRNDEKAKLKNEEQMKEVYDGETDEDQDIVPETKVTRSGRKVKFRKVRTMHPAEVPKPKKPVSSCVTCYQCQKEFPSLYRLQKHYDSHPTHIPERIHFNLFHCLMAIVKGSSEEHRGNIFIQQLEQLIVKLRSLLPCLLKNKAAGKACTINDDVGRLLGMASGKYFIDIEALGCVKDIDGHCGHNPPPMVTTETEAKRDGSTETEGQDCARVTSVEKWPTIKKRVWKQKQKKENAKRMRIGSDKDEFVIEFNDDMRLHEEQPDTPFVDNNECINVDQMDVHEPLQNQTQNTSKPQWNTPQSQELCLSETGELNLPAPEQIHLPQSQLTMPETQLHLPETQLHLPETQLHLPETQLHLPEPQQLRLPESQLCTPASKTLCLPESQSILTHSQSFLSSDSLLNTEPVLLNSDSDSNLPSISEAQIKFHSAHFDIRSSPIKPTSTFFRKFQINTELLAKYEAAMTSIESVESGGSEKETSVIEKPQDNLDTVIHADDTLKEIFTDEDLSVVKESFTLDRELKDWILDRNIDKSEDGFSKTNSLIEQSLLHIEDRPSTSNEQKEVKDVLSADSHDDSSVLNFLDTLENDLSYPGTEIRTNNGDFQLDLFPFTSS